MSEIPLPPSNEALAFLNGRFVPYSQVAIPVWDYGFTMGVTVVESLRTFDGKIRFLDDHLARLNGGVDILDITPEESLKEIGDIANALVDQHRKLIPGSEFSIGICITPGPQNKYLPSNIEFSRSCTTLIYTLQLKPERWRHHYQQGVHLRIVETREIGAAAIPKQLKNRSRVHYYLAEQYAQKAEPNSRALLLDELGNVAEATIASIAMVIGNEIVAPPVEDVLPGITAEKSYQLAGCMGLEISRRSIKPEELLAADEVLWFNTTTTLVPVVRVNGQSIGSGQPGKTFHRLVEAWQTETNQRLFDLH